MNDWDGPDPELSKIPPGMPEAPAVALTNAHPSVEAMKAAVELEIRAALGQVQTVTIGRMIQKAIDAALSRPLPKGGAETDWKDDPSADERWQAGCDFAMVQLCEALGVDPKSVRWDAATETLDGDVSAVIWNILRAKMGDDWDDPSTPSPVPSSGEVWRKALEDCLGCVTAAEAEGLHEIIAELRGRDELTDSLIDRVERRLLWVRNYAEPVLASPAETAGESGATEPRDDRGPGNYQTDGGE